MKPTPRAESKFNKTFWRYKVAFDIGGDFLNPERRWEEGVINEPISKKEARNMLFGHYGLRNRVEIIYLDATQEEDNDKLRKEVWKH